MKPLLFTVIFLLSKSAIAQDVILTQNGDELNTIVQEITPTEVKYKKIDNLNGPIYTMKKSEVFSISYENGTTDVFGVQKEENQNEEQSNDNMYKQGITDAKIYYKASGAFHGTLWPTLVFSPAALLSGTIVAAVPPKIRLNEVPNPELFKNNAYYKGYLKQAHKHKIGNVAAAFGMGLCINLATFFIILEVTK